MAIATNTKTTYAHVGIREDLSDVISNISPADTPVMSAIGRGPAPTTTYYEWQQDALAAANTTNSHVEGDDIATYDAATDTTRVGNYVQISRKTLILSDTLEKVKKAGRKSEWAYQIALRGKELKKDMEAIICENQAAVAGATATARRTGSLLATIKTNVDKHATGVNPVWTTAPLTARTDGTQRAWTEAMLKNVLQLAWIQGAEATKVITGPFNKTAASAFTGIATKTYNINAAQVAATVASADVYVSDFGTVKIIPSRLVRGREAFLLDTEYLQLVFLRGFQQKEMAKTGDAEKRLMIVEWGLKVLNEKALGLIADLTTS